jgi:hypothetical protein
MTHSQFSSPSDTQEYHDPSSLSSDSAVLATDRLQFSTSSMPRTAFLMARSLDLTNSASQYFDPDAVSTVTRLGRLAFIVTATPPRDVTRNITRTTFSIAPPPLQAAEPQQEEETV